MYVYLQEGKRDGRGWMVESAGRTSNIVLMLVTPDVSKLSGWLKAAASCGRSKGEGTRTSRWGPQNGSALER